MSYWIKTGDKYDHSYIDAAHLKCTPTMCRSTLEDRAWTDYFEFDQHNNLSKW